MKTINFEYFKSICATSKFVGRKNILIKSPDCVSFTTDSNATSGRGLKKVVLIRKLSLLERVINIGRDIRFKAALEKVKRDNRVIEAHEDGLKALDCVYTSLAQDNGVQCQLVRNLSANNAANADMIISVGGDGTFLMACSSVVSGSKVPVLGVNSSPLTSFGHYCDVSFDKFPDYWAQLRDEWSKRFQPLFRIKCLINGVEVKRLLAVNDILLAPESPAATLKYKIEHLDKVERHASSGIWIATAPGSTGGIFSAGGQERPFTERKLQFCSREVVKSAGQSLCNGFVDDTTKIHIRVPKAMLFFDGQIGQFPVYFGDEIQFQIDEETLNWVRRAK